ncbi:MAG: tRNA (cytidine(34)-2'-O)-methyltransferase [Acidimicrobiia bacterium]|nr:tRNA (cytidine(34)-2'-O)-methyltransferase [Acidimicrobiia bacterium]MDH4307773.1 tRNA (cytidine(34)-2'-O)-methyltransferase [Acidimicrobiia bacterium]
MFDIVFYRPEIPPNTGNAMRLSANTGCRLHLIEPLGFDLSDAKLRRAGMDYRDKATVRTHAGIEAWIDAVQPRRVFAFAKRGQTRFTDVRYRPGDSLLFGPESVGLPDEVLSAPFVTDVVSIPMRPGVRSLNLSNSAAIVVFEAWRQNGFEGAE